MSSAGTCRPAPGIVSMGTRSGVDHAPGISTDITRPAHQRCLAYWEVPMSTAKLQRILRFRMGSHLLPIDKAAICICLDTGVCVGSVTLELWVMRGTCSLSALLLQIPGTSFLHWLQSAQA